MAEDIWFVGKLNDLNDPQQLEELWAWMMKMQGRLNQFDPNSFSLAWIEGAVAGQVIQSMGVGVAPVWEDEVLLKKLTLSGLTASQLVVTDASKLLSSLATITVALGGTGAGSFTDNGVIYGNATAALGATAEGATGQVLTGSTGNPPVWSDTATPSAHSHSPSDITGTAVVDLDARLTDDRNPTSHALSVHSAAVASVDFAKQQAMALCIENRTDDPSTPAVGQMWLRTDL